MLYLATTIDVDVVLQKLQIKRNHHLFMCAEEKIF